MFSFFNEGQYIDSVTYKKHNKLMRKKQAFVNKRIKFVIIAVKFFFTNSVKHNMLLNYSTNPFLYLHYFHLSQTIKLLTAKIFETVRLKTDTKKLSQK